MVCHPTLMLHHSGATASSSSRSSRMQLIAIATCNVLVWLAMAWRGGWVAQIKVRLEQGGSWTAVGAAEEEKEELAGGFSISAPSSAAQPMDEPCLFSVFAALMSTPERIWWVLVSGGARISQPYLLVSPPLAFFLRSMSYPDRASTIAQQDGAIGLRRRRSSRNLLSFCSACLLRQCQWLRLSHARAGSPREATPGSRSHALLRTGLS